MEESRVSVSSDNVVVVAMKEEGSEGVGSGDKAPPTKPEGGYWTKFKAGLNSYQLEVRVAT